MTGYQFLFLLAVAVTFVAAVMVCDAITGSNR